MFRHRDHESDVLELFKTWTIQSHKSANSLYFKYLPYRLHLDIVSNVCDDFTDSTITKYLAKQDVTFQQLQMACYGHDILEEVPSVTYNDLVKELKTMAIHQDVRNYPEQWPDVKPKVFDEKFVHNIAEMIYAVTNEKGRNRDERANASYFEGIRNTSGATFVKLADRIGNCQFGKLMKGSMFEKYQKEFEKYYKELYTQEYSEMFKCLEKILFE